MNLGSETLKRFLIPLAVGWGTALILFGLRLFTRRMLRKSGRESTLIALRTIYAPSILWSIALALYAAVETSEMPLKYAAIVHEWIQVVLIFSVTLVVANLSEGLLKYHLGAIESPISKSGLIHGILRGLIFILGILVVLARLGVHIEPLLTALGVGGLAVSLALQDTLGNLFAGISLLIDKALRVGDRVKLDTGQEGEIIDIGWRTTKIQVAGTADSHDLLIIPNTKLAQAICVRRGAPVTSQ
jgi:small-conductance mechanosensitive channel